MKRLRKVYAESELFEPGRAILTDKGKTKLDGAAEWLKGYKTGEVVIAGVRRRAGDERHLRPDADAKAERRCPRIPCLEFRSPHRLVVVEHAARSRPRLRQSTARPARSGKPTGEPRRSNPVPRRKITAAYG
jgi:hypothetical protein